MCLLSTGTTKQEEEEETAALAAVGFQRRAEPQGLGQREAAFGKREKKMRGGGPREQV